jgi:hypothetical protein
MLNQTLHMIDVEIPILFYINFTFKLNQSIMNRIIILLCVLTSYFSQAQNLGINNTDPQAALDLEGDLRLRSSFLDIPFGLNHDVDITTVKSTVYKFFGNTFEDRQISGFTGGLDGRIITIF